MEPQPEELTAVLRAAMTSIRIELDHIDPARPATALPHLRTAQDRLSAAIDEAMAAVVLADGLSLRTAGQLAGLSENAVGPRLGRTSLLAAYRHDTGRVSAAGVERARYDLEQGRHQRLDLDVELPPPMRFRARRPG